ncbi:hypothetical protein RIF29_26088 [Crotalaria pallida]|uniref:Uncharacterized protein n=1 Tax=Crotalaria pallida TaxID=3830 RepID=A0AAN9EMZ3_CROPI
MQLEKNTLLLKGNAVGIRKSAGQIANPDFPRIKKRKRDEDPSLELDSKKAKLDDQGTSSDPSARAEVNPGVSQVSCSALSWNHSLWASKKGRVQALL